MAAFAAAVKIDSFAYLPVQDFGNAFSTFIAQNYGAQKADRIRAGLKGAVLTSMGFGAVLSALVWVFARPLMGLFVEAGETAVIQAGVLYLHVEGAFYYGIGCLFLLYGLYRALGRPGMSVVLTVISLGTRVALAYAAVGHPCHRGHRHLVRRPHRLVFGRRRRDRLLPRPQKTASRLGKRMTFPVSWLPKTRNPNISRRSSQKEFHISPDGQAMHRNSFQ